MQPDKKSAALNEFEEVLQTVSCALLLRAGYQAVLDRLLKLDSVADHVGRRVIANENVDEQIHTEGAGGDSLHRGCDVAVEGEPLAGIAGFDEVAREVGCHIDLEPLVGERVVPQDDIVVKRLGYDDLVVESKHASVGCAEDPDRRFVGVEVVVHQHAVIMHQRRPGGRPRDLAAALAARGVMTVSPGRVVLAAMTGHLLPLIGAYESEAVARRNDGDPWTDEEVAELRELAAGNTRPA